MATTDRHGFLLWAAGFTQSDTILNDLLLKLEVKLGLSVLDRSLNAPAGGESDGDCYIVGPTPAGAWASFAANDVVILRDGTWYATTPIAGWPAWVDDDNQGVMFDGADWVVVSKDLPLDKLDATADPTANDDSGDGYSVGSFWINLTDDKAFVCVDATPTAAVWLQASQSVAFSDAAFRIQDNADATKKLAFQVSGIAASTTRTVTMPDEDMAPTAGGVSFDGTKYVGVNDQTGTTYTLVIGDAGKLITMNNAAANTLTIPANASVAFVVGTRIDVLQKGAGQTTIAITSDTLNGAGGLKINAQWEVVSLLKITSTSWVVVGGVA